MADPAASVTFSFVNATTADATEVNTDFNDLITWANTYAIRRDGTIAFTAPASGVTPTSAAHLVTKTYADNGPPSLKMSGLSLTDITAGVAADNTYEVWGGTITITNPARSVDLMVFLTGNVALTTPSSTSDADDFRVTAYIELSSDGGTTYAHTSETTVVTLHEPAWTTPYIPRHALGTQHLVSGVTPTGDVKVRVKVKVESDNALAFSFPNFLEGRLQVIMKPA